MARLRLGVDIGGTFTDHVLFDEEQGTVDAFKTSTTPADLSACVMDGVRAFADRRPEGVAGLDMIAHGTTVNTNAILERRGARCALITTQGFRDILEIGRQSRPHFYDWWVDRPVPLIPRYLRLEVRERIDSRGGILLPLDEGDVTRVVEVFKAAEVEAVAICLLHAYANPNHEARIRAILERALPGVYLAVSSELSPEFREFERVSTAAIGAYVGPVFRRYIDGLLSVLGQELNPAPRLYIMQSSGGMVGAQTSVTRPHVTIESGPAAGVVATAELGRRLATKDLISFDMGGTTAKACLIRDGIPSMVSMLEVGGEASGFFGVRITGLPVKAPSIDLVECSAGGGSIAWVDVAGLLKVGPESAGARPGPACYNIGGTKPTVTDAHVVLGHIAPSTFLGGAMEIRPDLAQQAIQEHVAGPLGLPLHEAAQGILDIVNAKMVRILRVVSVTRGFDPREFVLVAYGGAGPLHAGDLGRALDFRQIIIPPMPGVFSAMGLLASDVELTVSATHVTRVSPEHFDLIKAKLETLERQCTARLDQERVAAGDRRLDRYVEMRYVRQNFELEIPFRGSLESPVVLKNLLREFHDSHRRTYGHSADEDPAEIVNFKVRGTGLVRRPKLRLLPEGSSDPGPAYTGSRPVFFRESAWVDCPTYDRSKVLANNVIAGPAILNEFDSTILLLPGDIASVNGFGDLIITRTSGGGDAAC